MASTAVDAAISAKLTQGEKNRFIQTTEELGLTPSAAIRIFVKKFNACRGFPFAVRTEPHVVKVSPEKVLRPQAGASGRPVLPSDWDEPGDDVYDALA